ncbi:VOC family protein [uncultured Mycobacterium sp.]|uniref:VOC family protein n=1 Tax=uncultured Mycobacterium sp. TaxID=171292 RepID=UPI0035CCA279
MTQKPIQILGFSHVCIAVSDMEASLRFYRDLLGLEVFFDLQLEGPSMEAVTGEVGARGRMIGGMLGGTVVELLEFAHRGLEPQQHGAKLGYTNISLSVRDVDATLAAIIAAGIQPEQQPVDIGGVRMFFVRDPDGTPIEFVSYPNGERTSAEMWGYAKQ